MSKYKKLNGLFIINKPPSMCPICQPILGPNCRHHEIVNCPLRKAMYCSSCGKGKHFTVDCPRKLKSLKKMYIPSLKPDAINSYMLPHKNNIYIEYLRLRDQKFDIPIARNRQLVEEHLKGHGYVLVNPIETHTTPGCGCSSCH